MRTAARASYLLPFRMSVVEHRKELLGINTASSTSSKLAFFYLQFECSPLERAKLIANSTM